VFFQLEEGLYYGSNFNFVLQNLTGGAAGNGKHVTDVTNASRTMLFNINTQSWDTKLLRFFEIPVDVLPDVRSSSSNCHT